MRVLLITGRLSESTVRRAVAKYNEIDVIALPISVAAFITPESAVSHLMKDPPVDYDLILLPGTIRGDVSSVEVATGISTFKGPDHPSEIPQVLELLGEIKLSKTHSASEFLYTSRTEKAYAELQNIEENWREIYKERSGHLLGSGERLLCYGAHFPMRVIAEIVNAPTLDLSAVIDRAKYYQSMGAHIIDIGMIAGKPDPEKVNELVTSVQSSVNVPVSIDTLDPSEIKAAVDAGVDLVLSVDEGNMETCAPYLQDVTVVVLPTNLSEGYFPCSVEERINKLLNNLEMASELGIKNVIADPVLEPAIKPGLLESLRAYQLFRIIDSATPVLFGLGNVTELIDADSTGVNGLLGALASEVNADLLFVPEYSVKARGSVAEVVAASKMMYLAKRYDRPPKDLGVDLLRLKEKRITEKPYYSEVEEKARVIQAHDGVFVLDKKGWFVIRVDRENLQICAIHYSGVNKPDVVIKGETAGMIYSTIIEQGLVERMDHVAYLGKELAKAELALQLNRSYIQDSPLF